MRDSSSSKPVARPTITDSSEPSDNEEVSADVSDPFLPGNAYDIVDEASQESFRQSGNDPVEELLRRGEGFTIWVVE